MIRRLLQPRNAVADGLVQRGLHTAIVDEADSVLIDEVESLASARKSALNGSEPSDSIRVVNAVLTQLDAIRRRPNVLVLTTSNITESIDLAFVDRADLKIYLGPPSLTVKAKIVTDSILELVNKGLVAEARPDSEADGSQGSAIERGVLRCLSTVAGGEELSGRALRKLPMLAFVYGGLPLTGAAPIPMADFLDALGVAIRTEVLARNAPGLHL